MVGKYQRELSGGERPSTRAQSRNLPSVFDIARRLGLSCIFGGLVSIYIDVEVYIIYVLYDMANLNGDDIKL